MQLESLEYFFEIAGGRTFLTVAEDHHISQSALSKSIKKLEEELGFPLLDRSGRAVRLTPAGAQIYRDLEEVHDGLQTMHTHIGQFQARKNVSIYLAIPGLVNIQTTLNRYHKEHPEVLVTSAEHNYLGRVGRFGVNNMIPREMCDMEIGHRSVDIRQKPEIVYEQLYNDCIVAVMSSVNPLAKRDSIYFQDLDRYTVHMNGWFRQRYEDLLVPKGYELSHPAFTNYTREELLWNIEDNTDLGLFYASDMSLFHKKGILIKAIEDLPMQPVVLSAQEERLKDPLKREFFDYIVDDVNRHRPNVMENVINLK